uniref:Uncharacterized protein n=1 Tax=Triatoma infestans TaxID=30076 RepID=A0A170XMJ8_TRIIF
MRVMHNCDLFLLLMLSNLSCFYYYFDMYLEKKKIRKCRKRKIICLTYIISYKKFRFIIFPC